MQCNKIKAKKGWEILPTNRKIDKSKYLLLIFGNFWSENVLKKVPNEYKSLELS